MVNEGFSTRRSLAVALAATIVGALSPIVAQWWFGLPVPFILFFWAVLLASWFGGVLATVVTTTSLALYGSWAYLDAISIAGLSPRGALALYLGTSLLLGGALHSWRSALLRARGALAELEERRRELDVARRAAEAANEAKSAFLTHVSHEIRTPMNAVLGMSRALLAGELDEEQRDCAATIHASTDSLVSMLNDLLDASKIEAAMLEVETIPFSVHACARSAIELVEASAVAKRLFLDLEISRDVPEVVVGDGTRLRQVLLNLVSNAIKFTEVGGVHVSIAATGVKESSSIELRFEVRDSGLGIPAAQRDRLFRSYGQADASTARVYGGTGLGLVICRGLIDAMGGSIEVESSGIAGEGSAFRFTTRVGRASPRETQEALEASRSARLLEAQVTEVLEQSRKVLVADDNVTNQKVALLWLRRLGCQADAVASGEEVLAALERERYDVVLMDIEMPRMDGIEATRRLRERWPAPQRPMVAALTGHSSDEDRARLVEAGFDACLTKPLRPDELADLLRGNASRAESEPPPTSEAFDPEGFAELASLLGPEAVGELLESFEIDARRLIATARQALERRELETLRASAHALKSVAASVAANEIARRCGELEAWARSTTTDWPAALEQVDDLDRALDAAFTDTRFTHAR